MIGRPTVFREEKVARLLEAIAGGATLPSACAAQRLKMSTVATWVVRDHPPGFRARYFQAFAARSLIEADRSLTILDDVAGSNSMPAVMAAKNRADARRWFASKMLAEYSEKLQIDGGSRAEINIFLPAKGNGQPGDDAKLIQGEAVEQIEDQGEPVARPYRPPRIRRDR